MARELTRRDFTALLGSACAWPWMGAVGADAGSEPAFRIRTITAGVNLADGGGLGPVKSALAFLEEARRVFIEEGHEVQTLRLATQPLTGFLPDWNSPDGLKQLRELDRLNAEHETVCSIGPVLAGDHVVAGFPQWAAELINTTRKLSFSCEVATVANGVNGKILREAAAAMQAIARETPGGEGNFRFAATACVPSGTPFFPAAWFAAGTSFSIGLESPNLLTDAFRGAAGMADARDRLRARLQAVCEPLARLARHLGEARGWHYLGIDLSPAPGLDASIGRAVETLTGRPFGSPSTLSACAAITGVLKSLPIKRCGYSGLMLPVPEDPVLAQRASEGRFGVTDLLLYSSVCGTGLDLVPLPGDTPATALAAITGDVAALAVKYGKPLSARLFPVPGKRAGETVSFENPYLTDTRVMALR